MCMQWILGSTELRVVLGVTKCANVLDDCGTQYMLKQYS